MKLEKQKIFKKDNVFKMTFPRSTGGDGYHALL
jgi:hypothetical protein